MKFQREMTVVITDEDMRKLLTEALCMWNLEHLRVWRVTQAEGNKFVVDLEPKPAAKPQAVQAQPKVAVK